MEKIMYRWWKKLVSLLNTNVSASFSTRPLFQVSRQLPTAAKGNRVHIMSAELNIKLSASVLLILCMIQSFNMVSTIQTKTTVHRRDEPEILSTKKRQYPSLSVINGARMRISDHESTIPPFHKLMQVPQCSWSYNQFQDTGDIWHKAATSICLPQLVVYSYGGSHWQYVELSQDSLKPLLVIIIESRAGKEWSFHCKLQWTLIHWWRVVWLKNKRVMMHGCKFHWCLHYSQSRDGSPPFGGAIAVMSLLPGAALNIRTWNLAK